MAQELEGLPGSSPILAATIQAVRAYMRDFPELNRLIAGEESSNRMIAWAVLDALSNFNGTPPFIGDISLEDLYARGQQHLVVRMTVEAVIESVVLLQMRNHLNYSTGGINAAINDKTPLYMQYLQYSKGYTEQRKQQVKVAMNISNILGAGNYGAFSELWRINASYLAY